MDRTIIKADNDYDGKISYTEFKNMVKDLNVGSKIQIDKIWLNYNFYVYIMNFNIYFV